MAEVERKGRPLLKLAALVALVVGGLLAARLTPLGDYLTRDGIGAGIEFLRNSTLAPVIFIALYAGATALAIPGTILTLAGGAVFGLYWGVLFNSIAANIGANAAFLLARGLGREGVRGLMGNDSKTLKKMDDVVGEHGFQGLLTLRLIPLVPFNALNFGSGLMPLKWSTYALATLIGIFPGTVVYTFFADALLQGSQEASREALIRAVIAGALLVLLSFLPKILKRLNISLPGAAAALLLTFGVGAAYPLVAQESEETEERHEEGGEHGERGDELGEHGLMSHEGLSRVLKFVVMGSRVDYRILQGVHSELTSYLGQLAGIPLESVQAAPRDEQLAFWINAYNACMLDRVVTHYPIERAGGLQRVKNAVAGRPANSVWQIGDVFTGAHCTVAGKERSQDEIEHEIIRPMGDPRIHFAVNCAAMSCPPLTTEAYVGARLDEQLDERVRSFMRSERHYRLEDGSLTVNKVLDWFADDFGGHDGLRSFFAQYANAEAKTVLEKPDLTLDFFDYDWTLNDRER
ncbi:MAG: VTT domain-containing protein [Longimicrobiales bacterium]